MQYFLILYWLVSLLPIEGFTLYAIIYLLALESITLDFLVLGSLILSIPFSFLTILYFEDLVYIYIYIDPLFEDPT